MIEADLIKVSTLSRTASVAGAMAAALRRRPVIRVQAVGAGAVNQAVKALALAREYVRDDGLDLICRPALRTVEIAGLPRSVVELEVEGWRSPTATPPSTS